MIIKVKSSRLIGSIRANASKSYAQRAYAIAALADTPSRILNTSHSDDAIAALGIVRNLGALVSEEGSEVRVVPKASEFESKWNVGEAGLSLRMFAPIAALFNCEITIDGYGSLLNRPTKFIANTLQSMGAKVESRVEPLIKLKLDLSGEESNNSGAESGDESEFRSSGISSYDSGNISSFESSNETSGKTNDGSRFESHVESALGLPLKIQVPMTSGTYQIDGNFTSQLLTGLLIALPTLNGNTQLIVNNLKSKPYIDMTLQMIEKFGGHISHRDYEVFDISGGQKYRGAELQIEADWSGLAFVLVAAAISGQANKGGSIQELNNRDGSHQEGSTEAGVTGEGVTEERVIEKGVTEERATEQAINQKGEAFGKSKVTVTGVQNESLQADRAIVDVLQSAGCELDFRDGSVEVESTDMTAFTFDATHCPDLFPPLCVLATQCEGESKISGVHRLQHKESNRGEALRTQLGKLGAKIKIEGDVMIISGKQSLIGAVADACGDHRIAMALVCAGLVAKGETIIHGAECISKSYNEFYSDIRALNGLL
jgi:5-enolpyruvylshikimate-3-phosphate synthase